MSYSGAGYPVNIYRSFSKWNCNLLYLHSACLSLFCNQLQLKEDNATSVGGNHDWKVRKKEEGKPWLRWVLRKLEEAKGFIGRGSGRKGGKERAGKKGREKWAGIMGGKNGREKREGKRAGIMGGKIFAGYISEGFLLRHNSEFKIHCRQKTKIKIQSLTSA